MNVRDLVIVSDPCFYQYTDFKEVEGMNIIELSICLSLIRKEQRRLKKKVYENRNSPSETEVSIYVEGLESATKYRKKIEQELFDKQGFVPTKIFESKINKMIQKHEAFVKKYSD